MTYSVFLLASDSARSCEHESQHSVIAFFLLDQTLQSIDMERYGETIDWQNECVSSSIESDLQPQRARQLEGCVDSASRRKLTF